MLNPGVEGLGRRVLRESHDVPAPDAGQATGPSDQQEAQGPVAAPLSARKQSPAPLHAACAALGGDYVADTGA